MMRIAKGKAAAQGIENVTFHTGPIEDFDAIEDGSLDGLCAYSILHLVEDRDVLLQKACRMLKPGGFFISSTVCLGGSWVPYGLLIGAMRLFGKAPSVVQRFTRETLAEDVRRNGFVDIEFPDVGAKPNITFMTAKKPA